MPTLLHKIEFWAFLCFSLKFSKFCPKIQKIVLWEDMSLLAMNNLYKNQVLAKQNLSSRKSHLCWHMQFLALLHAISTRLVRWPKAKLKLSQIWFLDYCNFWSRLLSTQMLYEEIWKMPVVSKLCIFVTF